jgi:hypothetical protein
MDAARRTHGQPIRLPEWRAVMPGATKAGARLHNGPFHLPTHRNADNQDLPAIAHAIRSRSRRCFC